MERKIRISWILTLSFLFVLPVFQTYQAAGVYKLHYMAFEAYASQALHKAMDEELTLRMRHGARYLISPDGLTLPDADSLLFRHSGYTGSPVVSVSGSRPATFSDHIRHSVNQTLPPDLTKLDSIYRHLMQREYPGAQTAIGLVNATDTAATGHATRRHVTPAVSIDGSPGKALQAIIVEPQRMLFRRIILSILSAAVFVVLAFVCAGYQLRAAYLQKRTNTFIMDYLRHITHQLKSPIAVLDNVIGYAESELELADPVWTQQVAISKRSIVKLTGMVNSVLRFSFAGKARMPLDIQCFDLREAILQAVEELQFKWAAARPVITVVNEMDHPAIAADKLHLCDAVLNLADNAIKYSPAGVKVVIHLSVRRKCIRIAVKDNGPGIPRTETGHIFKNLFRGSRSGGVEGHGLGLSYVQTVCKAHNGRVKVYSTVGKGSEFVIWLPGLTEHLPVATPAEV